MRVPLPRWLFIPAVLGAALIVLPLIGLLSKTNVPEFWGLITSTSALTALRLSLETSIVAVLICVFVGVPLAVVLARCTFPGRRLLRTLVLLPLVLPPVVGGIALLYTFGRMGLIGTYMEAAGIRIAFTSTAVVLAQSFVALPFMVMTVEGALSSQDERYEIVGLELGASPGYVLRRITLPLLRPALISGTVLSFARALGEFGATITFAGSLEGTTRTLPLEIYLQRETDPDAAVALSLVLVVIAIVIVMGTYGAQGVSFRELLGRLRGRRPSATTTQAQTSTDASEAGASTGSQSRTRTSSQVGERGGSLAGTRSGLAGARAGLSEPRVESSRPAPTDTPPPAASRPATADAASSAASQPPAADPETTQTAADHGERGGDERE